MRIGACYSSFRVPNLNTTSKLTHCLPESSGDHMNSLSLHTDITSLWFEKYIGTTRYCQEMLRFLLSVKFLPSLGRMAGFRNTITCGISTKLSGNKFKSSKVLGGTSQYTFHSWNRRHKVRATQRCSSTDFGKEPNFYKSVMAARTTNIPHTHSHTQISHVLRFVLYVNLLHSMEWITCVSMTTSHGTSHSLVHSISFHNVKHRFWFKETSACLSSRYTQWGWKSC